MAMAELPTFAAAFRDRRAIVPTGEYFQWHDGEQKPRFASTGRRGRLRCGPRYTRARGGRNLRAAGVLFDRHTVTTGSAAGGCSHVNIVSGWRSCCRLGC
jgi:hypothetical protein